MRLTPDKPMMIWIAVGLIVLFDGLAICPAPRCADFLTVKVAPGQSVRTLAEQYLGDPNRWKDLLRVNGLASAHEVTPGMVIKIPAATIFQLENEIDAAKQVIQQATGAGARIFAPRIIGTAIRELDTAIEKRNAGAYSAALQWAYSSIDHAQRAKQISHDHQNSPAEAILQNFRGQVHRRKPVDNAWKAVSQFEILQEGERIRTLSQSFAEIVFRDNSRLHLNENAQALIRKVRANLLDSTGEAKVSLVKGDVLALLSGGHQSESFRLDVPGVATKIKSQHFWVGHDRSGSRFANYDGQLEISSAGKKVVLAKNQGTVVPKNQTPLRPQQLLNSPRLTYPPSGADKFNRNESLHWEPVPGAAVYLVEFSRNAAFSEILFSQEIPQNIARFPKSLGLGAFYWRVTAMSSQRLPGHPSEHRFLWVMEDQQPPFLAIYTPEPDTVVGDNVIEVTGMVDEDVVLNIQGQAVDIQPGGTFQFWHQLSEGANLIVFTAKDISGNMTVKKRRVRYLPKGDIRVYLAPNLFRTGESDFLIGQSAFVLEGRTCAECRVQVVSDNKKVPGSTIADANGTFRVNLQMADNSETYTLSVVSPTGTKKIETLHIEVDEEPPVVRFNQEIPVATGHRLLTLSGSVEGASYLEVNGEPLPLPEGRFRQELDLQKGANSLRVVARDQVGNVAIVEKEIYLDMQPPVPVRHTFEITDENRVQKATLVVWAQDTTNLKKTAPFVAQIGDFHFTGHLIRNASTEPYRGSFVLPTGTKGRVQKLQVTLADYFGNRRTYSF